MVTKKVNNYVTSIILLIFSACTSTSNQNSSSEITSIQSVLEKQTIGWNNGNIQEFMKGYDQSDSLQFITQKGRTVGWQNVLNRYVSSYPTQKEMGKLQFKNLIVTMLDNNQAQVYGNWEVTKDSIFSGNFSLIMKKKTEGWKIIIDHTW
jgi:ABC-type Fe3+-hydroxamate transport system substrate-binding protein